MDSVPLCPSCKKEVEVGKLFCDGVCRKKYKGLPLPLAYRHEWTGNETRPVGLLRVVLRNIEHSPAATFRMRRGNSCDPTGIICELSGLGEWINSGGGLWYYQTPAGVDYLTMPPDVQEWSGLTHADIEKIQHGYDRRAGLISRSERLTFAKKIINDIITHYEPIDDELIDQEPIDYEQTSQEQTGRDAT